MPKLSPPITVEEFVRRVPDGQKADLLDGVIHVASPDSPRAARINVLLTTLVATHVLGRRLGEVYGPRSAFRLREHHAPEPDLAFVRRDRLHLWKGCIFQGGPDVAVEIVVEEGAERDTGIKREAYERAGVAEYWMVNLVEERCVFLRLEDGPDGRRYREVPLESGTIFRSEAIPGFRLDARWLLAAETPSPEDCLRWMRAEG